MHSMGKVLGVVVASLCLLGVIQIRPTTIKAAPINRAQSASSVQTDPSDEEQIRKVVTDSQFNETLIIYVNPATFDKDLLTKYWVPESKGGEAIVKVESSVQRLLSKRWHYSKDSANEVFEIRSLKIFPPGDVAEVRTYERWYVPTVDEEGKLVKERNSIIEYPVTYRLLKIEGKWLVMKSSARYNETN